MGATLAAVGRSPAWARALSRAPRDGTPRPSRGFVEALEAFSCGGGVSGGAMGGGSRGLRAGRGRPGHLSLLCLSPCGSALVLLSMDSP